MKDYSGDLSAGLHSSKDKYLVVAIHQIMEECGRRGIEKQFSDMKQHIIYVKSASLLEKIEVKSNIVGNHIDVDFVGVTPKQGFLDKVFDFNVRVVRKTFEIDKYVTNDFKITNEQTLRNTVMVVIKELEVIATQKPENIS
jgi:outer membrane lipoprotein-sorting protein